MVQSAEIVVAQGPAISSKKQTGKPTETKETKPVKDVIAIEEYDEPDIPEQTSPAKNFNIGDIVIDEDGNEFELITLEEYNKIVKKRSGREPLKSLQKT